MGFMGRMGMMNGNHDASHRSLLWFLVSVVQPGLGHAFAQAALFEEFFFQRLHLLIQQIIRLMNQADRDVRNHFVRTRLDEFAIQLKRLRRLAAQVANEQRFLRVLVPDSQVADSQVVAVVRQEFFQTGSADVRQFDFCFLRRRCGFAAFQDVLFARPSGLNHLIDGAITSAEILVGKAKGDVVDDFGLLEGKQGLVVTTWRDDGT